MTQEQRNISELDCNAGCAIENAPTQHRGISYSIRLVCRLRRNLCGVVSALFLMRLQFVGPVRMRAILAIVAARFGHACMILGVAFQLANVALFLCHVIHLPGNPAYVAAVALRVRSPLYGRNPCIVRPQCNHSIPSHRRSCTVRVECLPLI